MLKVGSDVKGLLESYQRDGFVILRKALNAEARSMLGADIQSSGREFFGKTPTPFDLKVFAPKHLENRGAFYSLLRYLPSLSVLSGCREIIEISQLLGIKTPMVMKASNIRMDMPSEPEFLFHWHQDVTYLLGSLNSITYWMPLTPVSKANSTIEVVPGSHKSGVIPFRYTGIAPPERTKIMSPKDIVLLDDPLEASVFIEAEPGDVIIFSQFLLHRSTPNHSDLTRWTVQIRHTDIDPQFIAAGCPLGDRGNIYNYQNYYDID